MRFLRNRVLYSFLLSLYLLSIGDLIVWAAPGDVENYLQEISKKCMKTYFPLQGFEVCKASVTFKVDCNGEISSVAIKEPPRSVHNGQATYLSDQALIYAIKSLGHLPTPPKEVSCPASVLVTFDGRAEGPMKITAAFKPQNGSSKPAAPDLRTRRGKKYLN